MPHRILEFLMDWTIVAVVVGFCIAACIPPSSDPDDDNSGNK